MEPTKLRRGKAFHRRIQADWIKTIRDGTLTLEQVIQLPKVAGRIISHKRGKMDLFVDQSDRLVSVIEIKSTNWNSVKSRNVSRLLASHRRQVWDYVSTVLEGKASDVSPGLIYPFPPRDETLRQRIEQYLNEHNIQVVWYDKLPKHHAGVHS